jgi:uroporphyrinogen decarboxylase
MNHRERVLTALRHEEPDRVPIDLGATVDSTIMAVGYQAFRKQLGLAPSTTRMRDVVGQTAIIEEDVRQALGIDLAPVWDEPQAWRKGTLTDGSPAEVPAKFNPQRQKDGSQVVFDARGNVVLKLPKGGHYFDPVNPPMADAGSVKDIEAYMQDIVNYDTPGYLDKDLETLAEQARETRENTTYAMVGFFGGHFLQAGQVLRGWETFLMDLMVNKKFAHALMEALFQAHAERFDHYAATVGAYLDVVHLEEDLGMQDRPLMKPDVYREMIKPYHQRLCAYIKSKCDARILLHSDGAISDFVPDFIEIGIDALNPVQTSAANMEAGFLKKEFGRDIAFWGAGCDPQAVLPFGTPQQVADEVKRHLDLLAPGGGFVFASIHNIQPEVPVENAVTMFKTALQYGRY